jgi:hypothetical protein
MTHYLRSSSFFGHLGADDDAHDVAFFHDDELFAVDLDLGCLLVYIKPASL